MRGPYSDWIQLGLLLVSGLCMLGGFAAWADSRYAKESEMNDMKTEVHLIYEKIIPEMERR